jgi:hypothetical protein
MPRVSERLTAASAASRRKTSRQRVRCFGVIRWSTTADGLELRSRGRHVRSILPARVSAHHLDAKATPSGAANFNHCSTAPTPVNSAQLSVLTAPIPPFTWSNSRWKPPSHGDRIGGQSPAAAEPSNHFT